jgi:hypothetical protein
MTPRPTAAMTISRRRLVPFTTLHVYSDGYPVCRFVNGA